MSEPHLPSADAGVPPGYKLGRAIDLRDDSRAAATIQVTLVCVVAVMIGLALLLDLPLDSSWSAGVVAATTIALCVAYTVLHELTHGAALRLLTGVRPTFAVRLPYLVTGSPAYLDKTRAIVVALAPVIIWGAVLVAALLTVQSDLVLTVYIVLTLNVASSAGDYYEVWAIAALPAGALIRDDGEQTSVFLPA